VTIIEVDGIQLFAGLGVSERIEQTHFLQNFLSPLEQSHHLLRLIASVLLSRFLLARLRLALDHGSPIAASVGLRRLLVEPGIFVAAHDLAGHMDALAPSSAKAMATIVFKALPWAPRAREALASRG
jgi:hypothetical protein